MIKSISTLPRMVKSLLILLADFVLLPIALWSAIAIRMDNWLYPLSFPLWLFFVPSVLAIPIFVYFGLYRAVIRYIEDRAVITILLSVSLMFVGFVFCLPFLKVYNFPRGALLIFWFLACAYIIVSRLLARYLLRLLVPVRKNRKSTLIYGAGSAGRQLAMALAASQEYDLIGFVDDAKNKQNLQISGLKVINNARMLSWIAKKKVDQVLLAMPSASKSRQMALVNQLEPLAVAVRVLPGMADLVDGQVRLTDAREVGVDELLGREPVPPNAELLEKCIKNQIVMVTGAGGSIGSELCRQIVKNHPKALVLFEISEFALYEIEQELSRFIAQHGWDIDLHPVLGSVQHKARLTAIMQQFGVQTIYHAAAYKHVPLVEFNISEGIKNNALGTKYCAEAAVAANVVHFVLISTDKAVRPTNVMGASKRMAELTLQALASDSSVTTRFSMVRFGNVLGSSGSVVPLFRRQIAQGGPVLVTHPEINRFFMTIPEAAELVIQAGAMGGQGEVFVLDMGEPVKIVDLARRMIHLSGYTLRDAYNPDGDIAIEFMGLRPGEKLYEELLIGDNVSGTEHPRIMKASESFLTRAEMDKVAEELAEACFTYDSVRIIQLLKKHVSGFTPYKVILDHLHQGDVAALLEDDLRPQEL
ncbi:MAG: polysaccharide biosynthesis protein [Neisseriaceae bacterium]|nr:polysaccharide biosynthesis protein [Neisseriaceae bacterium]